MAQLQAEAGIKYAELHRRVIRCGCGDPDSHNGVRGPAQDCPQPRETEDLPVLTTGRADKLSGR